MSSHQAVVPSAMHPRITDAEARAVTETDHARICRMLDDVIRSAALDHAGLSLLAVLARVGYVRFGRTRAYVTRAGMDYRKDYGR